MTQEEVNEMKDHQLRGILEQLSATINEWDSQKCPAMKAHLDRTNAAEEEEETPEGVEVDSAAHEKEEEEEEEEEEEKDTGASEETPDTSENETPEGEDGGDGGDSGECMTEEEVNEMKDHQLKGILEQLSATINEWDSQKCPAMKAHLDRTNAAEEEEETPEGVEVDSAG